MPDWNPPNGITETAERFIKAVGKYLSWSNLCKMNEQTLETCMKQGEHNVTLAKEIVALDGEPWGHAAEIRKLTPILAREMEAVGEDSTDVFRVDHAASGGGGGARNVYPIWPDLKARLQRIVVRQQVGTSDPPSQSQAILDAIVEELSLDTKGARGKLKKPAETILDAIQGQPGEVPLRGDRAGVSTLCTAGRKRSAGRPKNGAPEFQRVRSSVVVCRGASPIHPWG